MAGARLQVNGLRAAYRLQAANVQAARETLAFNTREAERLRKLAADEAQLKSRIMQRILVNDAEVRVLAEPWLEGLDDLLAGRSATLH